MTNDDDLPRELQLQHHAAFQRAEWRVSQVLWITLLLVMLATALGAFGNGVLSRAEAAASAGALRVEYDRVARFGGAARFVVHAQPQPDGGVMIALSRSTLEAYRIDRVTPPPEATRLVRDGVEFLFASAGDAPAPIILEIQPARRWFVHVGIRSAVGAVQFTPFILP